MLLSEESPMPMPSPGSNPGPAFPGRAACYGTYLAPPLLYLAKPSQAQIKIVRNHVVFYFLTAKHPLGMVEVWKSIVEVNSKSFFSLTICFPDCLLMEGSKFGSGSSSETFCTVRTNNDGYGRLKSFRIRAFWKQIGSGSDPNHHPTSYIFILLSQNFTLSKLCFAGDRLHGLLLQNCSIKLCQTVQKLELDISPDCTVSPSPSPACTISRIFFLPVVLQISSYCFKDFF